MRNLFVLAVALGFAGVAHAQQATFTPPANARITPTVQAGPSVACDGAVAGVACAEIEQDGDFSTAGISQTGAAHTGIIYTNSSAANAGEANTASITQSGTGADLAVIEQGADPNRTVKRTDAVIVQAGTGGNEAFIQQNVDQSGSRAFSEIYQNGTNNTAQTWFSANQGFSAPEGTRIAQDGSANVAYQDKDDERQGIITIEQNGMGNQASQYTRKDQANDMTVIQVGSGNWAVQDIYKGANATTHQFGDNNIAEIDSDGNGTSYEIYQGKGTVGADQTTASDNATTAGSNSNRAYVDASGGGNTLLIEQYGTGSHLADVVMADGADVDVLQDGLSNRLVGLGNVGPAEVLAGSQLTVDQVGNSNAGYVFQGVGGVGTIDQAGNSNVGTINQF
jgi:hypothetical protein